MPQLPALSSASMHTGATQPDERRPPFHSARSQRADYHSGSDTPSRGVSSRPVSISGTDRASRGPITRSQHARAAPRMPSAAESASAAPRMSRTHLTRPYYPGEVSPLLVQYIPY